MEPIAATIGSIINRAAANGRANPDDYLDPDGLLVCGSCHTLKQQDVDFPQTGDAPPLTRRVFVLCTCQESAYHAEREQRRRDDFEHRMKILYADGTADSGFLNCRFEDDDRRRPEASDAAVRYAECWDDMAKNNKGILLHGDVGTGKTFLAGCIANDLYKRQVSVYATSIPRITNQLQGSFPERRAELLRALSQCGLLILDDLGAERRTTTSAEQLFTVIDTRALAKRPLIVTTNLTVAEMEASQDLEQRRIYDRVLGLCPLRIGFAGASRRQQPRDALSGSVRNVSGLG